MTRPSLPRTVGLWLLAIACTELARWAGGRGVLGVGLMILLWCAALAVLHHLNLGRHRDRL